MPYDPATGYRTEIDEAPLIRAEVADVVALGPSARASILMAVCESAIQLLQIQPPEQRALTLAHRDPLPPDSREVLARLRERYRASRG